MPRSMGWILYVGYAIVWVTITAKVKGADFALLVGFNIGFATLGFVVGRMVGRGR